MESGFVTVKENRIFIHGEQFSAERKPSFERHGQP